MPITNYNSLFEDLDLSLLRYFFLIATFGGFSKASRATGVSQPTLSIGLQKLEKTLATPLVDRSSKAFSLTPAGVMLLTFCKDLETSLGTLLTRLDQSNLNPRKRLRLGVALSVGFGPLIHLVRQNGQAHIPLELELTSQSTYQLLAEVAEGHLDAALVPDDNFDSRLTFKKLYQDEIVFAVGTSLKKKFETEEWKKAVSQVTLLTYQRETPMRTLVDRLCVQNKLQFKSVVSANHVDAVKLFLMNDAGGAFILKSLIRDEIKAKNVFVTHPPFSTQRSGLMVATRPDSPNQHLMAILATAATRLT